MGGKNSGIPSYIWDEDGSKITEEDRKLERFKGVWEIFTISEKDNREFDRANEIRVLRFLADNSYRTQPYQTANKKRLDPNNPLTIPLTMNEMIIIISNFKNKAPGERGLTRSILSQLPRVALQRLNEILNFLIGMGYFTVVSKN